MRQVFESILRPLLHRQRFIRILPGKNEKWEHGNGSPEELAASAFSKTNEPVSVFKAGTDLREARTIAAAWLTRTQTPSKPVLAARFYRGELTEVGITIERTPGTTGVSEVDKSHYDLLGDAETYTQLVGIILAAQRRGENRIRRLAKRQLLEQFRGFLVGEVVSLTERARSQCEAHVTKMEQRLNRQ